MNEILEECISAFAEARGKIIDAIGTLWNVNKHEAWKDEYTSFSNFCEDGLKISRSIGSQYLAIYDRYIEQGGLTVKHLREADTALLYKALKFKGSPEKQYALAVHWDRADFNAEKAEECEQHEWITICAKCHIRKP